MKSIEIKITFRTYNIMTNKDIVSRVEDWVMKCWQEE